MSAWNHRIWYGFEPYRVLLLSNVENSPMPTIEVVSVWPDTLKAVSLLIPPETMVTAVGGYGTYRVAALAQLGRVEGVGDALLRDSLEYTLGIPIHQVYMSKRATVRGAWVGIMRQALLGQRSAPEVVEIIRLLRSVGDGVAEKLTVSDKNVLREKAEADGTVSLYFEPVLTDRYMQNMIKTIWREAAMMQVAVINASGKPQMAASWSRFPRIAGFDVVSVTDQQEMAEKTAIIFSDVETMNSAPGHVLAQLFPRAEIRVGEVEKYRAQVVVILGNDCWLWLTDREAYLGYRE